MFRCYVGSLDKTLRFVTHVGPNTIYQQIYVKRIYKLQSCSSNLIRLKAILTANHRRVCFFSGKYFQSILWSNNWKKRLT